MAYLTVLAFSPNCRVIYFLCRKWLLASIDFFLMVFCRTQNVEIARAEGEKIKKIGAAEAYTIDAVGKAEAERMRMKAQVYKSYGEAAVMSLVLEALPKVKLGNFLRGELCITFFVSSKFTGNLFTIVDCGRSSSTSLEN